MPTGLISRLERCQRTRNARLRASTSGIDIPPSIIEQKASSIFANLSIRREEKANELESLSTVDNEPRRRGNLENDRPPPQTLKNSTIFLFFFFLAPEGETTNGENHALNEPLRTITTRGNINSCAVRRDSLRHGIAGSAAIRKKKKEKKRRGKHFSKKWLSINRINPPNSKGEEAERSRERLFASGVINDRTLTWLGPRVEWH